jgi:hypothetical protein
MKMGRVKMKFLKSKCRILALLYCLLLTSFNGCGGGGGSLTAGGGIDGSGIISSGVVSAFGSIVINGTEFDTSEAEIIVNGEQGFGDDFVLANLDVGRVVTVEGTISEGGESFIADRVVYSDNVAGPVTGVSGLDPTTNEKEIMVLGQIVVVNFITKFKPDTFGFNSIALNDVLEVSGYLDDTGAIRATFIEKTGVFSSGIVVEVKGHVMNLQNSGPAKTFEINDLTVNYTSIAGDLPHGIPAEDQFVEVEGTLDTLGGVMVATDIELGDDSDSEDVDEFEIMGFVTEIISTSDIIEFKVGNQEVHVDPDMAEFVDGNVNDIVLGVKLEAEGNLESGILFADEVEFWKPDQIEVEDFVTDVVSETEFTVGDQDVQTDSETVFEGVLPDEIEVDMMIEVKGVPVDIEHSVLIADKVSLEED